MKTQKRILQHLLLYISLFINTSCGEQFANITSSSKNNKPFITPTEAPGIDTTIDLNSGTITPQNLVDTYSDTWGGTDGLGRSFPNTGQAPNASSRNNKYVGMLYFLWHGNHTVVPWDISKILKSDSTAMKNPSSPHWGPFGSHHYWSEPLYGYYRAIEPWIYERHAQMLADAMVDVIIIDVSNTATYQPEREVLCKAFQAVRNRGGKTPDIMFLFPFANSEQKAEKTITDLYNNFYKKNICQGLWFHWQGKPLALIDPNFVPPSFRSFFNYRKPIASYFDGTTGANQWSWLEVYPQHSFNNKEQMSVGVAQNARNGQLSHMSKSGVMSRSWRHGHLEIIPHAVNWGFNFQEQWNRALSANPNFIFVTGWNEWHAQRLDSSIWTADVNSSDKVIFVDSLSKEASRDIEPMKGGYGDLYYTQLIQNIRKFKGVRYSTPSQTYATAIDINGSFAQWTKVPAKYIDNTGDIGHRSFAGLGTLHYSDTTGRNDFTIIKAAHDFANMYFYAQTTQAIQPKNASQMLLFLKSTKQQSPRWETFDFVINRQLGKVEANLGGFSWKIVANSAIKVDNNEIMIQIPRSIFTGADTDTIEFKWADNTMLTGNFMEAYSKGDVAPNGRFTYIYKFVATKSSSTIIKLVKATGTKVLSGYPASNAIDGTNNTFFSSIRSPSSANTIKTNIAAWFRSAKGAQNVASLTMKARMQGIIPLGFPKKYTIYLTSKENDAWIPIGEYSAQPSLKGEVTISFPAIYRTLGVLIEPVELGVDNLGGNYFQLSELFLTSP